LRDLEGIFDELGSIFQSLIARMIDAAEDTAGVDLLANFDFQDDPDRWIDGVFFRIPARSDHGGGLTDQCGVDTTDVSTSAGRNFLCARGVRKQFEPIEYLRISALRSDDILEFAIARSI